jgi:ribosomal protein L22
VSAEEEKDVAPEEPKAAAKKAPAKKAPAKKASAKAEGEPKAAAKKPAAKKAAAKKPAAKATQEPAGEKQAAAAKADQAPAQKAAQPVAEKAAGKPAKAAPRSRGKETPATARRRVVRAHARYVRTSARKARMVCGHLRGKSVEEARAILAFTPREVARDWSKLLESAVANAETNHELLEDDLIVREAYADEGPTIKRFRPRAMGRATPIRKRTSHLTIALIPRPQDANTKRKG